jgi:hypothetical protein
VLFAAILIEGLGLPLPAGPWLLAVGALPARSQLNPLLMRGVTLLAFFIANFVWFRAQRRTARAKISLSYLTGARPCMAEPGIYLTATKCVQFWSRNCYWASTPVGFLSVLSADRLTRTASSRLNEMVEASLIQDRMKNCKRAIKSYCSGLILNLPQRRL